MTRTTALTVGLWASLALNAFLAALVGAHLVRAAVAPARQFGIDAAIARMAAILPPADAARFRATLAADRSRYEPARREVDQARLAVASAIGREPFDAARAHAAMQAWRERWPAFAGAFSASILDAVGTLSPAGRARLAAYMEHRAEAQR